jgi:hypothetical protein
VLLLTLMTLAIPASLPAATLTYPGAAPCNTTLQACVTAASAGDTIQLAVNMLIAEFVTIGKTLTIEPAPGFAPRVQALFVFVSTTDVDFTVQNLSGLNSMRALLGPGGGNLGLQVLNNVINGSGYMSAIDVTGGTGTPGTYGAINATVSGNRIRQTPLDGICTDAVAVIGVPVGFKATIVNNDITVNDLSQCGGIDVVVGGGAIATATLDRNLVHGANFDLRHPRAELRQQSRGSRGASGRAGVEQSGLRAERERRGPRRPGGDRRRGQCGTRGPVGQQHRGRWAMGRPGCSPR